MDRRFEQPANGEPLGVPTDLFSDPAKYDTDIPLWKRTVGFIKQYERSKPKGRDVLFGQFADFAVKDLGALSQIFDNFSLLSQARPDLDLNEITNGLITHLELSSSRRSTLPSWTPDKIEHLVSVGLSATGQLQTATQRMEAALFNAPGTIEEAVDLLYNAAFVLVRTTDSNIREELFSILCQEKPWFNERSNSARLHTSGMLSKDDLHLSRYFAYINTLEKVGRFLETGDLITDSPIDSQACNPSDLESKRVSEKNERYHQYMSDPVRHTQDQEFVSSIILKNPHRFAKIIQAIRDYDPEIDSIITSGMPLWLAEYQKIQELRSRPWPENLINNPYDPLNVAEREHFDYLFMRAYWEQKKLGYFKRGYQPATPRYLQFGSSQVIDIIARDCVTPEQKAIIIRKVLGGLETTPSHTELVGLLQTNHLTPIQLKEALQGYTGSFHNYGESQNIIFAVLRAVPSEAIGRLSTILEYHRPLLSIEQVRLIEDYANRLRTDLQKGFVRGVNKRGYALVVSDPQLRQLGYEKITIKEGSSVNRIHLNIDLDEEGYDFDLDQDYRIIFDRDVKKFVTLQDKAWLEVLVLSHLKKIICTEEDENQFKNELVAGEKQYEKYRKQVGRREHLRRQKPGWNYSTEAFNRCLKSHLSLKNLHKINQWKAEIGQGGTKETGIWTYVSGSEYVDTSDAKPIKVAFKNATEGLKGIVPLGQISTEELARIENEILGELEKN